MYRLPYCSHPSPGPSKNNFQENTGDLLSFIGKEVRVVVVVQYEMWRERKGDQGSRGLSQGSSTAVDSHGKRTYLLLC